MSESAVYSKENVGRRVRWVREYFNVDSQVKFARILGLPRSSNVSNWETGHSMLTRDASIAINQLYGISLDFLFLGKLDGMSAEMVASYTEFLNAPLDVANSTNESNDKPVK